MLIIGILVSLPCHASGLLFKRPRFVYAFTTLSPRCFLVSHSVIRVPCLLASLLDLYVERYIYTDFTQCDTGIGASRVIDACHGHTLLQLCYKIVTDK